MGVEGSGEKPKRPRRARAVLMLFWALYIYIYIEREREKEIHIYIYICICFSKGKRVGGSLGKVGSGHLARPLSVMVPVSVKKTLIRRRNTLEERLSEHQSRGWNAVSAAGLLDQGSGKRNFFSQTPVLQEPTLLGMIDEMRAKVRTRARTYTRVYYN